MLPFQRKQAQKTAAVPAAAPAPAVVVQVSFPAPVGADRFTAASRRNGKARRKALACQFKNLANFWRQQFAAFKTCKNAKALRVWAASCTERFEELKALVGKFGGDVTKLDALEAVLNDCKLGEGEHYVKDQDAQQALRLAI